jgi:hypothetical protein
MVKTTKQQQHVGAATFVVVTRFETTRSKASIKSGFARPRITTMRNRGRSTPRLAFPTPATMATDLRKPSESEADLPITG